MPGADQRPSGQATIIPQITPPGAGRDAHRCMARTITASLHPATEELRVV